MPYVIGIALILLGGYLAFFQRKKYAAQTMEIQVQQTKTVAEVREALDAMATVDPGYRELVEVKGTARCEQPVTAPYSGHSVAYYMAKTLQVSETTETYTDGNGNRRTRTNRHEDLISQEESGVPLLLQDAQGNQLTVETTGVGERLDLVKTWDRFENTNTYGGPRAGAHFRHFDIMPMANRRILGYKQIEETIALGASLYTLGEAYLQNGTVVIGPPKRESGSFIVTTKSEEQLVKSKKNAQTFAAIGGIACVVIGLGVILAQFL